MNTETAQKADMTEGAASELNAGLEVKRFVALMLFLAAAILECVIAWAVSLPDVLIIPAGLAWGYFVLPKVSDALMDWATSNASVENGHHGSVMPDTGERYTWVDIDGNTYNPSAPFELEDCWAMAKVGKKRAGRLLVGIQHDGYPS